MLAYVLIRVVGDEQLVLDDLKQLSSVKESHVLFGEWDVIAKVNTDSPEGLSAFVMEEIRSIKNVKLTSTLIVAK